MHDFQQELRQVALGLFEDLMTIFWKVLKPMIGKFNSHENADVPHSMTLKFLTMKAAFRILRAFDLGRLVYLPGKTVS